MQTQPVLSEKTNKASRIEELENAIKFDITKIGGNKKEIRTMQKKLKMGLEANTSYSLVNDEVKEKQKERKEVRKKVIDGNPELLKLDSDIRSMRLDNKMRQLTLSDALIQYQSLTGQLTIPGSDGDIEFEKVIRIKGSKE